MIKFAITLPFVLAAILLAAFLRGPTLPSIENITRSPACIEAGCQVTTLASAAGSITQERAFLRHFLTFDAFPNVTADVTTTPTRVGPWRTQRTHTIRLTIQEAPPLFTTNEFLNNEGQDLWRALTGKAWQGDRTEFCDATQFANRIQNGCIITTTPHPFIPGYPGQHQVTLGAWRVP